MISMDYRKYNGLFHDLQDKCPNATFARGEDFAEMSMHHGDVATDFGMSSMALANKFGGMLAGDDFFPDMILAPGLNLPPGRKGFHLDGFGSCATHAFALLHEVGHHLDTRAVRGDNISDAFREECRADGFAIAYAVGVLGWDAEKLSNEVVSSRARGLDGNVTKGAILHYTAPFVDHACAVGEELRNSSVEVKNISLPEIMSRVDARLDRHWDEVSADWSKVQQHPAAAALPSTGAISPLKSVAFLQGAARDVPSAAMGIRLWSSMQAFRSVSDGASMDASVFAGHVGRLSRDAGLDDAARDELKTIRATLPPSGRISPLAIGRVSCAVDEAIPGMGQVLTRMQHCSMDVKDVVGKIKETGHSLAR